MLSVRELLLELDFFAAQGAALFFGICLFLPPAVLSMSMLTTVRTGRGGSDARRPDLRHLWSRGGRNMQPAATWSGSTSMARSWKGCNDTGDIPSANFLVFVEGQRKSCSPRTSVLPGIGHHILLSLQQRPGIVFLGQFQICCVPAKI